MNSRRILSLAVLILSVLNSACMLLGEKYTLTLSVKDDKGGKIICSPERKYYPEYSEVTLTAVADDGWELASWYGITSEDEQSATVLMDTNRNVVATFRPTLVCANPSDGIVTSPTADFAPAIGEDWTFMVYLDGDNNLDSYAREDFLEIEKGCSLSANGNLTVIVLYDQYGDTGTYLYRIEGGAGNSVELLSEELGMIQEGVHPELNMGNPETLTNFLDFCKTEFPAEHFALMLWNHGGGAKGIREDETTLNTRSRHVCLDETSADILYNDEVQSGIYGAFPEGVDLISIDACLMGTVETAYEFRDLCSCYVASMTNVNKYGWNYETLFGRMTEGGEGSGAEKLAALMVDCFHDEYSDTNAESLSAVKTTELEALKTAIDRLSSSIFYSGDQTIIENIRDNTYHFFNDDFPEEALAAPYYDLGDLCFMLMNNEKYLSADISESAADVVASLGKAVITAYAGPVYGGYYGTGSEVKRGLSIFFSKGDQMYNALSHYSYQYWYTALDCSQFGRYGFLDFCTSDEDGIVESWRELMEAWYDPYKPPVGYTPGCW